MDTFYNLAKCEDGLRQLDIEEIQIEEKSEVQKKQKESNWGNIYLIRAQQLGIFGCRGYVGRESNLSLDRVRHHLRGSDSCTNFLIEEMRSKGCTPTYDIFGPYPVRDLDYREKQHFAALKEQGWSLSNRKILC